MARPSVHYDKELVTLSQTRGLPLITIEVNGKHSKVKKYEGRVTIQRIASEKLAKRVMKFLFDALKEKVPNGA